ncbi:MAG: radical SAM family heme chaperone HemW [Actinobacteria bacterium]|nr:radical SAM family heme chaperone HemW [Actinomycetota bacterium]
MSLFDPVAMVTGPVMPAHIYVHVPFCRAKCSYCDFASIADADALTIDSVRKGIESEVTRWASAALPGVVETVYIGGGTPTILSQRLVELARHILEMFPHTPDVEVTIEANPDSLSRPLLEELAQAGVTRISLGVQSFDATELGLLGRSHSPECVVELAKVICELGLDLSLDLICAIPGQSKESWLSTLNRAASTRAGHISVYPLSIEPGTPLEVACSVGLVEPPNQDIAAEHMILAEEELSKHGLYRYEVANYSIPGKESRHNMAYWSARSYLGIGPAAHSMLDAPTAASVGLVDGADADAARVRFGQPSNVNQWLIGTPATIELLNAKEAHREDIMLGMRLTRGVPVAFFDEKELRLVLDGLLRDGLVECVSQQVRATRTGWLLGNEIYSRIWVD